MACKASLILQTLIPFFLQCMLCLLPLRNCSLALQTKLQFGSRFLVQGFWLTLNLLTRYPCRNIPAHLQKSEEPNKKHKPEDQQTPSWAQEILREMKDLKSTLGTKCDEAKISADQAKQSANDTKKAFTSMESKIQDLERRLQILEAKPPSPSPNPQSSATLRARSQGAHVTEDEEQKRLRTAVVTGWNRDSMSKTVLQDVDELLKSLPRKIDVKVSTPGPRCSMAFLIPRC